MIEHLLWNLFDYGETYTFLLVWVVIPVAFLFCYMWIQRKCERVIEIETPASGLKNEADTASHFEGFPKANSKVNSNEANV